MTGPQIFHADGSGQIQLHKCSIVAPEIHDNIFFIIDYKFENDIA